jgi:hypothetical protein
MKTTREIHLVKGANLEQGIYFECEVTGDMLKRMEMLNHFLVLKSEFIREESLIRGKQLHP